MTYNPKEEALKIADRVPMNDISIEWLTIRLEFAYLKGRLEHNEDMKKWRVESEQK